MHCYNKPYIMPAPKHKNVHKTPKPVSRYTKTKKTAHYVNKKKQPHTKKTHIQRKPSHKKQKNVHNIRITRKPLKGGAAKCNPKRLNDLLSGNPPVTVDQELPMQKISASDFADYNMKGLGTTPSPPPKLPSGCIIL